MFCQMTTIRPENRPSAEELLTHPYCAEVAEACDLQMAEELVQGLPGGIGQRARSLVAQAAGTWIDMT